MSDQGLLKRYDTFIFDWDGTLARAKILMRLNEMLNPRWAYRKRKSTELIDKYSTKLPKNMNTLEGKIIRRHIRIKEAEVGLPAILADISLYLLRPSLHSYSREVLEVLNKKKVNVALFTNGAIYRIMRELTYLNIKDYFSVIVSAQSLNTLKPNPLGINVIIKALHTKRDTSVYIGDMVNDVEAAKYAGIHSCAIADGFTSYSKLEGARPDHLFKSMEAFKRAL